jgi:hypothetical protein
LRFPRQEKRAFGGSPYVWERESTACQPRAGNGAPRAPVKARKRVKILSGTVLIQHLKRHFVPFWGVFLFLLFFAKKKSLAKETDNIREQLFCFSRKIRTKIHLQQK